MAENLSELQKNKSVADYWFLRPFPYKGNYTGD